MKVQEETPKVQERKPKEKNVDTDVEKVKENIQLLKNQIIELKQELQELEKIKVEVTKIEKNDLFVLFHRLDEKDEWRLKGPYKSAEYAKSVAPPPASQLYVVSVELPV